STARRIIFRPCPNRRRRHGKTTGGRFLVGPGSALHVLVGNLWRIFSRTLVFRRRPVSGSTVSRRRVVNRQPIRSSFQCGCESADAISHSAVGSNGFPVLPVRRAAYLFQSPSLCSSNCTRAWCRVE